MRTASVVGTQILVACLSLCPAVASAQEQRLRVSFGTAMTAGFVESEWALVAGAGYRFTDHVSFEVDGMTTEGSPRMQGYPFTFAGGGLGASGIGGIIERRGGFVPGSPSGRPLDLGVFPIVPPGFDFPSTDREGRTTLATVGFRYQFPVQTGRLLPYVSAGVGVSRTSEQFDTVVPVALFSAAGFPGVSGILPPGPKTEVSSVGLAAGLGLGGSVRLYKGLSVDVDARFFRLDGGRNLGRFGGGASYRF